MACFRIKLIFSVVAIHENVSDVDFVYPKNIEFFCKEKFTLMLSHNTYTHSHTISLSLSLTHSHTILLSLTRTRAHTHTLSL